MPNTPSFCSISLANSVFFADALSSTWPLKFAPTQGFFLCHFVFSLRESLLRHDFSYNSCTYESHIYSSWAKLQTCISSWLLEALLGYFKDIKLNMSKAVYLWSFSSQYPQTSSVRQCLFVDSFTHLLIRLFAL